MSILLFAVLWWLVGALSMMACVAYVTGELNLADCLGAVFFGLFGPLVMIICLVYVVLGRWGSITIWRRK